ncbi:MAG: hypothetical protein ACRC30_13130 [Clostridium sp.]
MRFIEGYLEKCLKNKAFHKKTSLIAGGIIGIIFFIFNVITGIPMEVAIATGIATIITFTIMWYFIIGRLHKSFSKQMIDVDVKESKDEIQKKRENARRLMEERNAKRNKKNKKKN